jgi:hypothetical protein
MPDHALDSSYRQKQNITLRKIRKSDGKKAIVVQNLVGVPVGVKN